MTPKSGQASIRHRYTAQLAYDVDINRREQTDIRSQLVQLQARLDQLLLEEDWLTGLQGRIAGDRTEGRRAEASVPESQADRPASAVGTMAMEQVQNR